MTAPPSETDWLAAEYVLGLLEKDDLAAARDRLRHDPEFATEVAVWTARLLPLINEAAPAQPPAGVWSRILGSLQEGKPTNDNGARLQRRVRFWRNWSAGATALAASLGLLLLVDQRTPPPMPSRPPQQQVTGGPLVATMGARDSVARLVASWEPVSGGLTVAAVAGVTPVSGHDHELWLIPNGGVPHSLGVMPASGRMYARLSAAQAAALRPGVTLAVSLEPAGGSPSGQPTGSVIAAGQLLPT